VRFGQKPEELLVAVGNFTPISRQYRIGVPREGAWVEVLNTDAQPYGGNGDGNKDPLKTDAIPWNGKPWSLHLMLPGMSTAYFLPVKAVAPKTEPRGAPVPEPELPPRPDPAASNAPAAAPATNEPPLAP
jgi:hypothetical protein